MYYDEAVKDVYLRLNTSEQGLSADAATLRLHQGLNEISSGRRINALIIFLRQFQNFLIVLMIFAAVISYFIGDKLEFFGVIAIIMLSTILGFVQEYKAEKAMEALKKMSAPNAKVLRDNIEQNIPTKNIVPGDIVILGEGDIVPADIRLINVSTLEVDESSLTGESMPVPKSISVIKSGVVITEQENMAFMSTVISRGKGIGVVTSTGMNTEFGKIAGSIQEIEERPTPLQLKYERMARQLTTIVVGLVVVVFLLSLFHSNVNPAELFIFSLSLAVAAIPSSLTAIVTISLGLGAKRLAAKNMIIKKLPAAESLGSVTVICTDKTGTLTKNEMTITKIFVNIKSIDVTGHGYEPRGSFLNGKKELDQNELKSSELMFRAGYLCNNSELNSSDGKWSIVGDSTEGALIVLAKKAGLENKYFEENFSMKDELPFDSDRKLMTVIYENYLNDKTEAYVKGAPDIILNACTKLYINGRVRKLTKKDRDDILRMNNQYAEDALRVLGIAYRDISKIKKYSIENIEKDLVFVGLVGMIDPPREGVAEAIRQCEEAGITVVMITGDHPITAKAVARQIGLLKSSDKVMTGPELDKISDSQLEREIANIRIIARALPIQKTRIVDALKKAGHIVAMTGDGVNDAPALKKADIGIAMGITGTDVSKEVAEAILVDDHFSTIVNGVIEGRNIYDKIIKSTKYLLACNVGEVVSVFFAILLGFPLPMLPLQLLMMNLLTDGLPALGLGSENAELDVMQRPPRNPNENPISAKMFFLIMFFGIAMGLGTLLVFSISYAKGLSYAQTMAFTTLVMFEMFAVMSARSFSSFSKIIPFSNKWLTLGITTSVLIQVLIIYVVPLQRVFGTVAINLNDWLMILAISSMGFIMMEFGKIIIKEKNSKATTTI